MSCLFLRMANSFLLEHQYPLGHQFLRVPGLVSVHGEMTDICHGCGRMKCYKMGGNLSQLRYSAKYEGDFPASGGGMFLLPISLNHLPSSSKRTQELVSHQAPEGNPSAFRCTSPSFHDTISSPWHYLPYSVAFESQKVSSPGTWMCIEMFCF